GGSRPRGHTRSRPARAPERRCSDGRRPRLCRGRAASPPSAAYWQVMATVIDSDQHLVEYRGMWAEHIDPQHPDGALEMMDDEAGWTWMSWRGKRLGLVDIQAPGDTASIGDRVQAAKRGDPCAARWGDVLPDDHWNPRARRDALATLGVDEAVLFPNF